MSGGFAGLALFILAQAPPVFRTSVEAVYVDVFVARTGAPVLGLAADDFVVTDNGVRQRIEIVNRESIPTTVVLVLDVSASVAGERLARLRVAARAFLSGMAERDEAALVTFNHKIELRRAPTTNRSAVVDALERVKATGATAVIDGPCKEETPVLLDLYHRFNKEGFEIIGISLDTNQQDLENYLTENKIPWPQYFDGNGWQNTIASRFKITGIPATVLIDKNGIVINRCLRGEKLKERIDQLFGPVPNVK